MTNDAISRTNNYLILFNKLSKKGLLNNNDISTIHALFKYYNINTETLSSDFWSYFIKLCTHPDSETIEDNKAFLNEHMQHALKNLSYDAMIEIYYICLRTGLFTIGYIFRNHATEINSIFNKNNKCNTDSLLKKFSASLELNKLNNACEILKYIFKNEPGIKIDKQISILSILSGNNNFIEIDRNKTDFNFYKYIYQKKIALVGPAIPTEKQGTEIDRHDLVVRLNYMKDYDECSYPYIGKKCDIAYFNGGKGDFAINHYGSNFPKKLRWIIFRSHKYIDKFKSAQDNVKNVRSLLDYSMCFLCENLNMIQHTVCDLLSHNTTRLHIYNVDLFLTDGRYKEYNPKGYISESSIEKKRDICRSAVHHDPYTQYKILHNLWTNKRLTGDAKFTEVMSFGCNEYMKRLQSIYGDIVRFNQLNDKCQFI